jgi:hypothetical protein
MNKNGYAIGPKKALKLLENVAEYLHFDHIFVKKRLFYKVIIISFYLSCPKTITNYLRCASR